MSIRVLDPTAIGIQETVCRTPRLVSLAGCTVGLLDNGKIRVRELLDHVEEILRTQQGVAHVVRLHKPDFSRPVPPQVVAALEATLAASSKLGSIMRKAPTTIRKTVVTPRKPSKKISPPSE